jgi:hypothetical protein
MIVQEWPKSITTADGIICNPTPQQCMDAGYELAVPPTAEEIAEQERLIREQLEAHEAEVEALRMAYRQACNRFCVLAGLTVVNKFESATAIQDAIEQANGTGDIQRILGLTQIALSLEHLITELRRKDGDDAWKRI